MLEVFNTPVEINGSTDDVQLRVKSSLTQTVPLQSWETDDGDAVARVQPDGRIQSGSLDTGAGATDDAQIEVYRHEDSLQPRRGLNISGAIKDTLSAVTHWSVHELFLKGTAGVRALHSALRVRLVNQNSGTPNDNGELRASDVELLNEGGSSGDPIPVATGVHIHVGNGASGYIDQAYGLRVAVSDLNAGGIADAYAVHATGAKTRLADVLELHGERTAAPDAEEQVAKIYVKADGKLYARLESGNEYLLSSALTPTTPDDDGKFLRSDGTWQSAAGGAGVSSVGLTAPADFTVTGSPITTAGTLALARNSQAANLVLASPDGAAGVPQYRALVGRDLPFGFTPSGLISAQTTDNTLTLLASLPIPEYTVIHIEGYVIGAQSENRYGLTAHFHALGRRREGRNPQLVLYNPISQATDSAGNPNVVIDIGDFALRVRVQGVAGETWRWFTYFNIITSSVAP
jgi:hypothetical protein